MIRRAAFPLALVLAVAVLGGCASSGGSPMKAPPGVPAEFLHFSEPSAAVGQPAPEFALPLLGESGLGDGVASPAAHRGRPLVLVFASFT